MKGAIARPATRHSGSERKVADIHQDYCKVAWGCVCVGGGQFAT